MQLVTRKLWIVGGLCAFALVGATLTSLSSQSGESVTLSPSKTYRPSAWQNDQQSFGSGVRSAAVPQSLNVQLATPLPQPLTIGGQEYTSAGNSGNHIAQIIFNYNTPQAITCLYRGGADQSKPWERAFRTCTGDANQITRGMVYGMPRFPVKCYLGSFTSNLPSMYNSQAPTYRPAVVNGVPVVPVSGPVFARVDNGDTSICTPSATQTCCNAQTWDLNKTQIQVVVQGNATILGLIQDITYQKQPGADITTLVYQQGGTALDIQFDGETLTYTFPANAVSATALATASNNDATARSQVQATVTGNANALQAPSGSASF